VWFAWWRNFLPILLDDKGSPTAFGINRYAWLIQVIYLCLLVGWLSFPAVILAPLGFSSLVRQSSTMRCVAASCLLTFGFYIFVRFDQSHGWGDRYFHGTLGCLILVAVAGYDSIKKQIGSRATTTFLLTGVAAGFLIQLPVRAGQAESIVAPYARANFVFHNVDSDLVAFDPRDAWYSADLRRNDPFLRDRPIILTTFGIPKDHIGLLQNRYPNLIFINASQLQALGLSTRQYLRPTTVDVRELN
jgi:hypothetical protein